MHPAISREFHFGSLLRFALPTVIMMIFMSMYTIVDGIFVSRFVGTDALSATNIVYPALNLVLAVAIMLSTGGSAIVARKLGEGDPQGAGRALPSSSRRVWRRASSSAFWASRSSNRSARCSARTAA